VRTWAIVGALAALAIAAVVDALPDDAARDKEPTRAEARLSEPRAGSARRMDAAGVLYYTDEFCRLRALRLPAFEPVEAPEWDGCGFSLSPDGRSVVGAGIVWQRQGDLRAAGVSDLVYVVSDSRGWEYRVSGEAPAFKPDGALTFVRGHDIVELTPSCRPLSPRLSCERVLLTGRDLLEPLREDPNAARDPAALETASVKATAWLTQTRLVAALAFDGADEELIAVYEGKTLIRTITGFGGRVAELLASPRRSYAAARLERPSGFVLLDRAGQPFVLTEVRRDVHGRPPFTGGHALAWSPDDAWTAIARRDSVVFFRMGVGSPAAVRMALVARDLAWTEDGRETPAPDHQAAG
jgi:hypothetical protein